MRKSVLSNQNKRSPGELESGFLPLPVEFERDMRYFTPSALKVYLSIRFRTIFSDHVSLTTAALARITGLSEDSVRKALIWLENPAMRPDTDDGAVHDLPQYITREDEPEHKYSQRLVQTIYVVDWENPRKYIQSLRDAAETRDAASPAGNPE